MTQVGVTSEPGGVRAGAIERFEAFARALERMGLEDFRQVVVGVAGDVERAEWRAAAERLAATQALTDVLQAARSAVREHVARLYAAGGFRPTWAGLNWGLSTGSAADQAAAMQAADDAVTAAVVEPFASPDLVAGLRGPFDLVAAGHPMPSADGDLPPLFGGGTVSLPGPLLLALGLGAVLALAVGGWPLVAIPVVVASYAMRRRRH